MSRPAILLDRDGTVIVERDYLHDPALVELERGAAEGLRRLAALDRPLVIVSNQSGVGRGRFTEAAVGAVNDRMVALLAMEGIAIEGIFFCPHAPDALCTCRKPAAGLGLTAAAALDLDLARSWMIGDKRSDLEFADAVGARGILLLTGHGKTAEAWASSQGRIACETLAEAADFIATSLERDKHMQGERNLGPVG